MHNPAKFICMTCCIMHKKVKVKNGINNSKNKILILLQASIYLPVVQSYDHDAFKNEMFKQRNSTSIFLLGSDSFILQEYISIDI